MNNRKRKLKPAEVSVTNKRRDIVSDNINNEEKLNTNNNSNKKPPFIDESGNNNNKDNETNNNDLALTNSDGSPKILLPFPTRKVSRKEHRVQNTKKRNRYASTGTAMINARQRLYLTLEKLQRMHAKNGTEFEGLIILRWKGKKQSQMEDIYVSSNQPVVNKRTLDSLNEAIDSTRDKRTNLDDTYFSTKRENYRIFRALIRQEYLKTVENLSDAKFAWSKDKLLPIFEKLNIPYKTKPNDDSLHYSNNELKNYIQSILNARDVTIQGRIRKWKPEKVKFLSMLAINTTRVKSWIDEVFAPGFSAISFVDMSDIMSTLNQFVSDYVGMIDTDTTDIPKVKVLFIKIKNNCQEEDLIKLEKATVESRGEGKRFGGQVVLCCPNEPRAKIVGKWRLARELTRRLSNNEGYTLKLTVAN